MAFSLSSLRKKFDDILWGGDGAPGRRPVRFARLIVAVVRDTQEGDFHLRATSLVYTTLLSLAPLLALCFSVLKGFGVQGQIEPFLVRLFEPLGDQSGEIAQRIIGFVNNIQVGVLGAVGFAFLVYSSISLLQQMEAALNDIWRVPAARSFSARVRDYFCILLIGPLFLFLSVGMTTALRNAGFMSNWLGIDILGGALEWVFAFVPYLLFVITFTALYMFMPNTRVHAGPAIIAAMFTSAAWKAMGWLFALFIAGSASYAAIYSVFAALVLFIIWLYIGWMIALVGACISYYLQNPSNQPMSRGFRRLSTRLREKLALQVCAEVGRAFYKQAPPVDVPQLSATLMLPAMVIENITDSLVEAGVLEHVEGDVPHFVPGCPFEATSVDAVLRALRATDERGYMTSARLSKTLPAVESAMQAADAALAAALGGVTLKQLALEESKA